MTGIAFDDSELRAFAADLTAASQRVQDGARGVVEHGAVKIKNQLRAEMSASKHFKGVARGITYDLHGGQMFGVGVIEAEIGPEKGRPGSLANIAYFGSSRGGGTVPDPQGALDAEVPHFEKALLDLAEESL